MTEPIRMMRFIDMMAYSEYIIFTYELNTDAKDYCNPGYTVADDLLVTAIRGDFDAFPLETELVVQ